MRKIGIVACSDPYDADGQETIDKICKKFVSLGFEPIVSDRIIKNETGFAGTAKEKADILMSMYKNPDVTDIFDISGGDLANEVLPYLDFKVIKDSPAIFWGYSDLTTIDNAINTATGKESVLYPPLNLISDSEDVQTNDFCASYFDGKDDLYNLDVRYVQGTHMEGEMIGGNIRCLLKLAGTPLMPSFDGKILVLEGLSGNAGRMATFLNQFKLMGAFEKLSGIVLGGFIEMKADNIKPDMTTLTKAIAGDKIAIAETDYIGHFPLSRAARIGRYYSL